MLFRSGLKFSNKNLSHFSGLTSGGTVNYQQLNHNGQVSTNNSRPKPSKTITQKSFVPFSAQTLVDRSVLESRSTGNTSSSSGGTKQSVFKAARDKVKSDLELYNQLYISVTKRMHIVCHTMIRSNSTAPRNRVRRFFCST